MKSYTFAPAPYFRAALSLIIGLVSATSIAADLTAYTNDWPPYNFEDNKQVTGISTDIFMSACTEAKLSCVTELVPWARAYATVSKTPNTVLYTTARIPSRETEFLWVGPLLPRVTWVYGRAGTQERFKTLQDLATAKVGVVRGESSIKDLETAGIPASAFVNDSTNHFVLRSLEAGMVDAMVDTEIGMAWNLRESNFPPDSVVKLLKLSDKGAYYLALNRDTPVEVHTKLQQALDKLKQSGAINRIIRKYIAGN